MPGVIKINPDVFKDKRDAVAVAWNEALRLFMEDEGFEPEFEITPEQGKFFAGTAYAADAGALKKTVAARIATRDTSVPSPSPEQKAETALLLDAVLEKIGPFHKDAKVVKLMREGLGSAPAEAGAAPAAAEAAPAEAAAAPASPEARSAMRGGDVMTEAPAAKKSWSAAAIDFLMETERFRERAYRDPSSKDADLWAVGYGNQFHPGQKVRVRPGDRVAPGAQAREYLADAMLYNVNKFRGVVGDGRWDSLTGGQKVALASWTYNVGTGNASGSTLAKRLKAGDDPARVLREELPKWHSKGKLAARRRVELGIAKSDAYQ